MNWEAIGAIGEVLGAAGVIITLAYLAVQIRQNSRQLERSHVVYMHWVLSTNILGSLEVVEESLSRIRELIERELR